jgi:hypothetical protein
MLSDIVNRLTLTAFNALAAPLINQVTQSSNQNLSVGQVGNVYNGVDSTSLDESDQASPDNGTADNIQVNAQAVNGVVGSRVLRSGDYAVSVGGRLF